jgi:hypothetical protein
MIPAEGGYVIPGINEDGETEWQQRDVGELTT